MEKAGFNDVHVPVLSIFPTVREFKLMKSQKKEQDSFVRCFRTTELLTNLNETFALQPLHANFLNVRCLKLCGSKVVLSRFSYVFDAILFLSSKICRLF